MPGHIKRYTVQNLEGILDVRESNETGKHVTV